MASAAVRFHPAAAQEAESTYDWYAARSPEAAHGFPEELGRAIVAIGASPRTWPRYGSRARRYVLPRYRFSLVYILRGEDIEIVAVAHGRRRPGYWRAPLISPLTSACSGRRSAPPLIRRVRCLKNAPSLQVEDHMNQADASPRKAVILGPGEGRSYPMGRIGAVFKADGPETDSRYSISERCLEPHTQGPGAHSHPEDDTFYVIEGTMSVLVGEEWTHATQGSFVLVPGGVTHDFENRSNTRAAVLNLSIPGPFEPHMPGIVQWFTENPPQDAGT